VLRLALFGVLATGCGSGLRPPPESIPNDYMSLSFTMSDGGVVVLRSWHLDERAHAFDGVGTWFRGHGFPEISGPMRVPMRLVAHVETVRDEPPDLGVENAIVGVLAAGIIATEIANGIAGDCD